MANWTEEDFQRLQTRRAAKPRRAAAAPKKAGAENETPAPAKQTSAQKLQALGRLAKGEMNKTEEAFSQYLNVLLHNGDILWWKFEAIKLMLANNTSLTVDFAVMEASGLLVMIDVKGAKAIVQDDARVKMKVAAKMFPFVFRLAYPKTKKAGGGWDIEEIRA